MIRLSNHDCRLKNFRDYVFRKELYWATEVRWTCDEPPKLHKKQWSDIDASEFACIPETTRLPGKGKNLDSVSSTFESLFSL